MVCVSPHLNLPNVCVSVQEEGCIMYVHVGTYVCRQPKGEKKQNATQEMGALESNYNAYL